MVAESLLFAKILVVVRMLVLLYTYHTDFANVFNVNIVKHVSVEQMPILPTATIVDKNVAIETTVLSMVSLNSISTPT